MCFVRVGHRHDQGVARHLRRESRFWWRSLVVLDRTSEAWNQAVITGAGSEATDSDPDFSTELAPHLVRSRVEPLEK